MNGGILCGIQTEDGGERKSGGGGGGAGGSRHFEEHTRHTHR